MEVSGKALDADAGCGSGRAGEPTRAIDILLSALGAGSFANVSPLQRIWRDSAVAARHAMVGPQISYESYGKAPLGIEEQVTPLI